MSVPNPFGLSTVTRGLSPSPGSANTSLTEGIGFTTGLPVPAPNSSETPDPLFLASSFPGTDLSAITGIVASLNPPSVTVPTTTGLVDLGQGYSLFFDSGSQQAKILPAVGKLTGPIASMPDIAMGDPAFSYTGSDLRIILEATNIPKLGNLPPRLSKTLLECTTISIAVYRAKAPVSAAGYIGAKGFARGRRTIAGSVVLTQFAADVLMRFLHGSILQLDSSKDTHYNKVDQLPPFNLTLLFANEMGYASYCRLLGVELLNVGTTYSHNDMYTEQIMSYMAADMTPLMPITANNLINKPIQDRKTKTERTVQDVWDSPLSPPFVNPDIVV